MYALPVFILKIFLYVIVCVCAIPLNPRVVVQHYVHTPIFVLKIFLYVYYM